MALTFEQTTLSAAIGAAVAALFGLAPMLIKEHKEDRRQAARDGYAHRTAKIDQTVGHAFELIAVTLEAVRETSNAYARFEALRTQQWNLNRASGEAVANKLQTEIDGHESEWVLARARLMVAWNRMTLLGEWVGALDHSPEASALRSLTLDLGTMMEHCAYASHARAEDWATPAKVQAKAEDLIDTARSVANALLAERDALAVDRSTK